MEKTFVTKLPAGDIVEIRKLPDGTLEVVQRQSVEDINKKEKFVSKLISSCGKIVIHDDTILDDTFVLIEASKLSLDDNFMNFNPKRDKIKVFKDDLSEVIKKGIKDFYRPIMDPSFAEDGISFESGKKPAVGKVYNWWEKVAKDFMPELGSRLGTRSEYIAFLGVLIKELVNQGWTKEKAWKAVCVDSDELGHYWNYKEEKHDFEPTGSRAVIKFYDLANTYKILVEDNPETVGFWMAGGCCHTKGKFSPLADFDYCDCPTSAIISGVGWLVLEA